MCLRERYLSRFMFLVTCLTGNIKLSFVSQYSVGFLRYMSLPSLALKRNATLAKLSSFRTLSVFWLFSRLLIAKSREIPSYR